MEERGSRAKKINKSITKGIVKVQPFSGFFAFIRTHGIMSLAIGLFLGASLKTVLDSLMTGIVNPVIGVVTGNVNLNNSYICLKTISKNCTSKLNYGSFISSVIEFILAAFVVYIIIIILRLDKLDQEKKK
jgi:large conductance mechanosensitive channel